VNLRKKKENTQVSTYQKMEDTELSDMLLKVAIELIEGNRVKTDDGLAAQLLWRAIGLNSMNQAAWLWRVKVMNNDDDKIECLEKVVYINPNNDAGKRAQRALNQIRRGQTPIPQTVDLLRKR